MFTFHMYAHIIIYDIYHYLSKYILIADNKYNASFMEFAISIIAGAFLVPSGSFPQKHRKEELGAVMLWREEKFQEVNNKLKPSR